MRPQAQRIAIAKACGWLKAIGHDLWCAPAGVGGSLATRRTRDMPDYLNSLDAMHEAEETLRRDEGRWRIYAETLKEVCAPSREYWRATAAQRAEAFLKTLGLWTD